MHHVFNKKQTYTWDTRPDRIFTEIQNFVFNASFETKWELFLKYRNQSLHLYWKLLQLPKLKFGLHAVVWITLVDKDGFDFKTIKESFILTSCMQLSILSLCELLLNCFIRWNKQWSLTTTH